MNHGFVPPFLSYQGFHQLIPPREVTGRISNTYLPAARADLESHRALGHAGGCSLLCERDGRHYACVRLVDTFLDPSTLSLGDIVETARGLTSDGQDCAPPVQLLLMSPFAQIASVRFEALREARAGLYNARSPLHHTNRTLHEVVTALSRALEEDRPPCPDLETGNHADDMKAFDALVELVREAGDRLGFEIRFYDKYTDAPLYVLGKFVLKGVVLDRSAADDSPWLVFVDDPNQPMDLYDSLVGELDQLWENAYPHPHPYGLSPFRKERELRAFVAMPMDETREEELRARLSAIKRACEAFEGGVRVQAIRVDEVAAVNRSIDDLLVEEIRRSDLVIADLSEARPNVYYEAGLGQAMNKPVLLVMDGTTEDGAEFDLRNYRVRRFTSDEELTAAIQEGLDEVFRALGFIPSA